MNVAVIHDVFIEEGGAERVLLSLLKLYPHADLYIPLLSARHRPALERLTSGRIITSVLNRIPFIHSASILLKPLLYWYWELLDLTDYDLVISMSHSFSSKSVVTSPFTAHVSYIHTPPRYLYTEYNETQIIKQPFFKVLLVPLLNWLRVRDFIGAQRPDILVANSRVVQRRITKYYRRESAVVTPPILIPTSLGKRQPRFYLCVSRLAKQKRTELAIEACNKYKLPLKIVGTGGEEDRLKAMAGPTIEFVGRVPDKELKKLYAQAKALIYCSVEEDFGMVPVEAMAHGVPVVGYRSGGTAETVVSGQTGILFDEFSPDSLYAALKQCELKVKKGVITATKCRRRAQRYSEAAFLRGMKRMAAKALAETR